MYFINKLFLSTLIFAVPVFAREKIEVFAEASIQMETLAGLDVFYYDLRAPILVKKRAPRFSSDEKIASTQAKAFFETAEGNAYKIAMRDAYRGKQKMMQYQLQKIPAIVFESGKYVIYGTTDVVQAVQLYRQHIQAKQE